MDCTFIETMKSSLDDLESAFNTFSGTTFTEDVWSGIASENAKNLIEEKIKTKITSAKEKLSSLEQAISYANKCDDYKSKIDSVKSSINSLDKNSDSYDATYKSYNSELSGYQNSYNSALSSLKGLDI